MELRHAVVATDQGVLIPLATTAATAVVDGPGGVGKSVVIGDDKPALSGTQILAGLKTERAQIADGADAATLPLGAVGLSGVLDETHIPCPAECDQRVEIGGLAGKVYGDDGASAFGQRRLDGSGIDAVGVRGNVDEDRNGANEGDGGGGGYEGIRRDDDFISHSDTGRLESDLQSRCAAANGTAMAGVVEVGEYSLDLGDAVAQEPFPGPQDIEQGGLVFGAEDGPRRKGGATDRRAAVQRESAQTLMPCSLRYADTPFLFMVRKARADSRNVIARPSSGMYTRFFTRFGSCTRLVLRCEWLTLLPTIRPLPETWQILAITYLHYKNLIELVKVQDTRGWVKMQLDIRAGRQELHAGRNVPSKTSTPPGISPSSSAPTTQAMPLPQLPIATLVPAHARYLQPSKLRRPSLVLVAALGATISLQGPLAAETAPVSSGVHLVDSGAGYVRLLFLGPRLADLGIASVDRLSTEHLRHFTYSALVGLPLEGDVELTVIDAHVLGYATGEPPRDLRWDGPAWADEPALLRHQRVVPIGFGPSLEGSDRVAVYDRVLVELRFSASAGVTSFSFDRFESSYRATIINYDQARPWRSMAGGGGAARAAQAGVIPEEGMLRLTIRSNGIYRVTGEELKASGADLSTVDPAQIRVLYGGGSTLGLATRVSTGITLQEIAAVVEDGGDGRFDKQDYILFYGEAPERWEFSNRQGYFWRKNPYTRDNVYWIDPVGSAPATRAAPRSGAVDRTAAGIIDQFRERIHEEDERLILRQLLGINSGYDWYWDAFTGNARNFTFLVNDAVANVPASVRVAFFGWTNESHLFDLRWNEEVLGRYQFSKSRPDTISAIAQQGATEGLNQLGVFHRDANTTRLDWYEVDYVRRLVARGGELTFDWPIAADGGIEIDTTVGAVGQFQLSGFSADGGVPRVFEISGDMQEIVDFEYVPSTGMIVFQDWFSGKGRAPRYLASQPIRWKRPAAMVRDTQQRLRSAGNRADYVVISHAGFMPAASRLAEWRGIDDRFGTPFLTMAVDVQDIYDEFSGGLVDPMAIRAFVNNAVDTWAVPPVYITLLGDGTYDYKNNSGVSHTNWIPPYQDGESTYDEWYVRFEGLDRFPDAAIGRLAVQSLDEAQAVVDKIIAYDREPESGPWQAHILLVADDISNPQVPSHFESYFVNDAEFMARDMPSDLDMTKLYIGAYQLEGRTKPKARDEFIRLLNEGALILTYLGHGNPEVLAHEQIFLLSRDLVRIDNGGRLPFIYTAASQVGVFDDPSRESMPETLVKMPGGGAIGFVAATRVGFHASNVVLAKRFHQQMYRSGRDHVPMGLALMEAKQLVQVNDRDRTNIQRYSLFGDSGQRLNRPRLKVALDVPDSLEALMEVEIRGQVVGEDGTLLTNYQGEALVRAFDSSARSQIEGLQYEFLGAPIFRVQVQVRDGRFQTRFRVPKDITYRADQGRVSAYVTGEDFEPAFGARTALVLEGTAADAGFDETGPEIAFAFANQPGFRDGDFVSPQPTLAAVLSDPSGINITGETGHGIELWVDDTEVMAVTQFFTAVTDHTQGVVEFSLGALEPGQHTIRLKAWDTFNNSSVQEATFVVAEAADAALADVLFHPNPTADGTGHFVYTLTVPSTSVRIQVFGLSGRRVDEMAGFAELGYNQVSWTPAKELANGAYFYRLEAVLDSGETVKQDGWVQVLR